MADGTPSAKDVATDAKDLYDKASDINSLAEAQDAVRRLSRMIYYLASLQTPK